MLASKENKGHHRMKNETTNTTVAYYETSTGSKHFIFHSAVDRFGKTYHMVSCGLGNNSPKHRKPSLSGHTDAAKITCKKCRQDLVRAGKLTN